jgi:quinol monooxygenase YgiN
MIVVTGRVRVAAESCEQFIEIATEMCRSSREEDGCSGYRVYGNLEQPGHYIFVEEWADDAALQHHFTQPHTGTFMAALGGLLDGPADALFHTTSSTRRLEPGRGLVAVD